MRKAIVVFVVLCLFCSLSCATPIKIESGKVISPGEEFNITIETNRAVIGVMLNKSEFTLISCSEPYRVSGDTVALAIINATKAECSLKAPSKEGEFVLEGKWIDFLNESEGIIRISLLVGNATSPAATVVTSPTATPPVAATTTPETPGFEFITAALSSSLVALRRWLK